METQQPNGIAVIIPVWNGMQDLPGCLAALSRQQGVTFDVFAVDNASTDGSADYISEHWPDVHLIRNDANLGFSRACNIGLSAAQDRSILVLLNQDTEVFPDWLARLIAPMQHDVSIGIAGSKAIFPNGTIEHAGGRVDKQGIGHHIGRGEPDRGQFGFLHEVDFVTGAALAITRSAYRAVGGFDEQFSPAYYEDVELCHRVRRAGFRVVYVPDSALIHKESSALLDGGHDAEFMLHRNRLRFVLKHWSVHQLVDDFMPAEQRWLDSLGWQGEQIVAAMHHAYLYQLVRLNEIVEAREAIFPAESEEVNGLAAVLLGLRAVYPLRPANLDNPDVPVASSTGSRPTQVDPGSRLLDKFRRRFPRTSRSALLSPVTRPLVQLTNQQQLAEVLVEYIRENNREIAELAREVEILKEQFRQNPKSDE